MLKIKDQNLIKANRHFGLIMTTALLVMGALIPFIKHKPFHTSLLIIAIIFLLVAFIMPGLLEKPRQYWLWLGEKLGIINTNILFTLIYLSLFSLVHLAFVILRRDRLKQSFKKYSSTYLVKTKITSFTDPF
jgi:hypothetical protein